jgi:hypothetical protein
MTYGWAALAADALAKAGLTDAYDLGKQGKTLHDGIDWLIRNIVKSHTLIATQRETSGSRTLAWMEYYIARFPGRNISKFMDDKLSRGKAGMFGGMAGGATTCMVMNIEQFMSQSMAPKYDAFIDLEDRLNANKIICNGGLNSFTEHANGIVKKIKSSGKTTENFTISPFRMKKIHQKICP